MDFKGANQPRTLFFLFVPYSDIYCVNLTFLFFFSLDLCPQYALGQFKNKYFLFQQKTKNKRLWQRLNQLQLLRQQHLFK